MISNEQDRHLRAIPKTDSIVPVPTFRCDDCGAIPEEFQPIKIAKD